MIAGGVVSVAIGMVSEDDKAITGGCVLGILGCLVDVVSCCMLRSHTNNNRFFSNSGNIASEADRLIASDEKNGNGNFPQSSV